MKLESKISKDGKIMTITIDEKFDFNIYRTFRELTENIPETIKFIIFDFSKTLHIDSSALGMLMFLRQKSHGNNTSIKIVNSNSKIREILTVSGFHQVFEID